ncbi:GNAT family N-acetyltransferase [Paenibacillus macerans]|uniref:GNAT family N-acetyltransferase n=1 Tax=Paenibacillus macerans TaxID=44252 RepID=UPI003D31DC09
MNEIAIRNLAELEEAGLRQAAEVFVDGFYDSLRFFAADRGKLARALEHALVREQFAVALTEGRVVGIFAFSTGQKRAFRFDKQVLRKELGWLRGGVFYILVRQELEKPLELKERQCYFESVATAEEARGRGIATKLHDHLLLMLDYDEYILEVVDTNSAAIRLYEKLGYTVFKRKPQRWFRKQAGFNARLYMKKQADKPVPR